ncbi:MAG TPA: trypsin-like serine protease [Burkholderiaceae bacterium]|nr:trypsin-like serine protease [Burkholderiaceae bacterium]
MHSLMKRLSLLTCVVLLVSCGGDGEDLTGQCSAIGLTEKTGSEFAPKITSGRVCTDVNKSPVLAIIKNMPDGSSGLCTGTLITATQVLTAAHCLSGAASIDVIHGISADQYARMRGSSWVVHPEFAQTPSGRLVNDIGVVNMVSPLSMTPIPIAANSAPKNGEKVSIAGFGLTGGNASDAGVLRIGAMVIASVEPELIIGVSQDGNSNTCFGDSGGPLLVQQNGQAKLAGTTSYGSSSSCALGESTAYMNLQSSKLMGFLRSTAPSAQYN